MFKLSFILLILTLPLLEGAPVWGAPLWVWGSLGATTLYALMLLLTIEKEWDDLKGDAGE